MSTPCTLVVSWPLSTSSWPISAAALARGSENKETTFFPSSLLPLAQESSPEVRRSTPRHCAYSLRFLDGITRKRTSLESKSAIALPPFPRPPSLLETSETSGSISRRFCSCLRCKGANGRILAKRGGNRPRFSNWHSDVGKAGVDVVSVMRVFPSRLEGIGSDSNCNPYRI